MPQWQAGTSTQTTAMPGASSSPSDSGLESLGHGSYICLHKTSFPSPPDWKSFDELSKINQEGLGAGGSDILKAIQTFDTSPTSNLDPYVFSRWVHLSWS